ncbi:MAG: deoxyribonuclease IV [Candidatus Babeliales bacterium]
MRAVGLHLRIYHTLLETYQMAAALQLPLFQFFLVHQQTRKHIALSREERAACFALRDTFAAICVHGAYWINVCQEANAGSIYLLKKELRLAVATGATQYILHPGSVLQSSDKDAGIQRLVHVLDDVMHMYPSITVVLENTAHGNGTIGSDINDLGAIQKMVKNSERLRFCIDTAHAHSYGYDLQTPKSRDAFIATIDAAIGLNTVALIHCNNTFEKQGSKIDKHVSLQQGVLTQALPALLAHPAIKTIPVILELPELPMPEQLNCVEQVRAW